MRIIDLRKTYKLKYEAVEALKGVSFDLPDKGMVFILGKSGCGKSTLLNVLSGLDNFDDGDIIYNGKSLKDFSASELDSYRNSCCGFVFQEYNLIPELNVQENIALALDLQGEKDTGKISAALKQVGLEGYESRKIAELSGGQKQRVAIARSIVKEPQIIFADEPSGALDSDTGASIFELLRELSKDKLILVVSHDREAANRYGDRIIELSDGEIISDTDSGYSDKERENKYKVRRSKMPLKSALKIGCSNFKFHPIRLIATIFLAMIAFTFLGVALNPVVDNLASIMYSTMEKNDLHQSSLIKEMNVNVDDDYSIQLYFTEKDRQKIEAQSGLVLSTKYCESGIENAGELPQIRYFDEYLHKTSFRKAIYYNLPSLFSCISEDGAKKFGFSVYKSLPKNDNEIAITAYTAEVLLASGLKKEVTDKDPESFNDAKELVGNTLVVDGKEYTICGIVDTKFNAKKYEVLKQVESGYNNLSARFNSELNDGAHNLLFVNHDGFDNEDKFNGRLATLNGFLDITGRISSTRTRSIGLLTSSYEVCSLSDEDGIYLPITFVWDAFFKTPYEEIFKKLRDEHWELHCDEYYEQAVQNGFSNTIEGYYNQVFSSLNDNPYGITGNEIYFSIISENKDLFAPMDYTIESAILGYSLSTKFKGFYLTDEPYRIVISDYDRELNLKVLADKDVYDELYSALGGIYPFLVVSRQLLGRVNFNRYVDFSATGERYLLSNYVVDGVRAMEGHIRILKKVMIYLAIAFAVFAVLLLLNFMLHSINEKTNTIGILKSLGSSNFNLIKIFIWEGLIVGALIFAASLVGHALLGWLLSLYFSSTYSNIYIAVFGVTPLVTLILFGTILVFAIIGCILPIARLSRLKPMEYLNKVI